MKEPWILVVEDNVDDVNLIVRAIEKNGRRERTSICFDASEALRVLYNSETLPSMVFLDGHLMGMQSTDFLSTLRREESTRYLPVVLFSGHTHVDSVERALSAGANSYVCKPMDFEQMMDHLSVTLRYWLDVHCSPELATPSVQK